MGEERGGEHQDRPWSRPAEAVLEALGVELDRGLSTSEVRRRRNRYGPNRLREARRRSTLAVLLDQFKSLIVALLAVAAVAAFAYGEIVEGVAVVVVLAVNGAIGFFMEIRAVRSMQALREMAQVDAHVRREGEVRKVSAEDLVPGDLVVLEGGDVVTADLRLVEASKLQANESALTGESVPVDKAVEPVAEDAPVAERPPMLYKGTAVTRGSGVGVVVGTGMETELGHISSLVAEAEPERTPLERRLDVLGRRLVWLTLAITVFVAISGILAGRDTVLVIETAIALAVATVPEGLPIVATIALARGMVRMSRRNALVEQLSAVETLGSTNLILTDKTGTLTENRMSVTDLALADALVELAGGAMETEGHFTTAGGGGDLDEGLENLAREALRIGVLCNNAEIQAEGRTVERAVGEPTEVALLVAGAKVGLRRDALLAEAPERREEAFDPDTKMMATFHEDGGDGMLVAVKGAPEAVLDACSRERLRDGDTELDPEGRSRWIDRNEELAGQGLRVLALASRRAASTDEDPYRDLTLLGLVGLLDPPREDVKPAILACRKAGIDIVMITGDHAATARNVARAVGLARNEEEARVLEGRALDAEDRPSDDELARTRVFARVDPKQKLDLIALHQGRGSVVAMTGDGVNDAPALKKADIGVAMGVRGTQVAKEAAAMVLQDDAFSTIVAAVEEGRAIFDNIRKFVLFLLSCNVSEILVVGLAAIANAPLPILPLQILYLNLITDVFPALALGVGEGSPDIMKRPPRDPDEPVLTRGHWIAIGAFGALLTAAVLGALALALLWLGLPKREAVTVSFLTLAFGQLWHVFDMRARDAHPLRNEVTGNPWIWGSLVLCTGLLVGAVYIPPLAAVLEVAHPGAAGWGLVAVMSLLPTLIVQVYLLVAQPPPGGEDAHASRNVTNQRRSVEG